MTDHAASDFRLYHSNSLEVLAGLLAEELRTPAPGASLLAPDMVLIPQVAMRRWLQATLAATHGVAANLEFLTPGEFVARALAGNLGASDDELDAAALRWHLYAALTDAGFMADPALAALAAHVHGPDPLRPWGLAGELAAVFEKYQAWRRDWLLRWEGGADPDDPQAILWRRLARGRGHRARRIQHYLDRFEGSARPLPQGLPSRLFAFAVLNVSPDVLRVLATQARAGTLHLYVPSPTREYWGDLQRLRAGGARGTAAPGGTAAGDLQRGPDDELRADNRLLQAWGAAGRDFMALLGGYEVVHPSVELPAHADPGEGGGGLRGSLLRRLQSDLFHRRAAPGWPPRDGLDRNDPSLQVHACHTRLRELQVLHDQLRALFDDPRFDPPLQPREVAVLAPDIDPYIPYLDAVFGDPGSSRLPYALADASPLAGEPLADVFLRLLALPVSRFGLEEILDLLASPPLVEASGLEAAAFARLRAWLSAAGARWGLDANHRARLDAPADDAYTWAFALDRLLLGHASGSDDLIAIGEDRWIAPMPELEGGALDALDTLIRLLRVLARHAASLGEAMPPDHWRERLLGLLDALLPQAPERPATQRALDRLRSLIDGFAGDARGAGFEAEVPAEAVRAHFASVLGEADTRAPLLTGGISIGRMVPMRLLPFRVICLLGMDDGDFPRRDPAAGLNRLTAELGSGRRRHGDRSTRDDDRYLFLQLFAAAQDVFYLSYQGADPRDGSVREPSVLVSELIDAAAQQHLDPDAARKALVVRHALQPFAPTAFGAGEEPRRFSYRREWWPAAGRVAGRRRSLSPWFEGAALASADAGEETLSLDALRRFLLAPAETFLQQRLGLRLDVPAAGEADIEPLLAPGRGLVRHRLRHAVFEALLRGEDDAALYPALRARGLLPSGPLGGRTLAALRGELAPYAEAFAGWRGDAVPDAPRIEVAIDASGTHPGPVLTLHGRLADAYPTGLARLRFDTLNGPAAIRNGLDWLLASAAGLPQPLVEFHDAGDAGIGPHPRAPLAREQAREALRRLLALRAEGLRRPLMFAPSSAWELFSAGNPVRGLQNAAKTWFGGERQWSEGDTAAWRLALRGRDPFGDAALRSEFARLAAQVYSLVAHGAIEAAVDEAVWQAAVEGFDAGEDAA